VVTAARVPLISALAALGVWEIAAHVAASPFFPPLSQVAATLSRMIAAGEIVRPLVTSLGNLVAGFALAAAAGTLMGAVMARYRRANLVAEPYLNALLAAPSLVFVPVLFALFGASRAAQIATVFLHAVFVITATTLSALRHANPALIEMAAAFAASERQVFWKVRWPEAWPLTSAGLRLGVLLAVKGMVNGEMFITLMGLGALMRTAAGRFEADRVLALLVVIVVVARMSMWAVDVACRRIQPVK
jgi:NitT/TauT family transport system permease protein